MQKPTLKEVIKASKVIVHKDKFAYLKCKYIPQGQHFLISQDNDEITVVTSSHKLTDVEYIDIVKWFKLFEIRVSLPFLAKGFLAKITNTIAKENLNVLVVSTFSKDYILVKNETYHKAVEALQKIGFSVTFEK